jgi:hypothetical protein
LAPRFGPIGLAESKTLVTAWLAEPVEMQEAVPSWKLGLAERKRI